MRHGVSVVVRPGERRDVPEMLVLMRALAVFEGYIERFRVTEADLIEHGFGSAPRFGAFVAEHAGKIVGIAVHYQIPWTFDLKPTVILKELFVAEDARGRGVGHALFDRLRAHAVEIGAARVSWTVLADNDPAKRFYEGVGGAPDSIWEPWTMVLPGRASCDGADHP
jgi:GNAT superfamily N-acetyltransferase